MAALLFRTQRGLSDEATLIEIHQTTKAHLVRRIHLFFNQSFLTAVEIHIDQQESCVNSSDIQCEHLGGVDIKCVTLFHQHVPNLHCIFRSHPDFIAEIACVSSPRHLNRHACY